MPPKVMVVDDEADVRESTVMVLQSLGYEAVAVSDSADILDAVEREKPALVLQDLRMPGLNVSGLVAALRLNPATSDVPLVFFSANAEISSTAARYDVWGYLPKPFTASELSHLVRQVLGKGSTRKPATPQEVQREVREVFHDYWNLLSALGNYVSILDHQQGLAPQVQKAVTGLDDILLKIETKTDRLRAYIMTLAAGTQTDAPPAERNGPILKSLDPRLSARASTPPPAPKSQPTPTVTP